MRRVTGDCARLLIKGDQVETEGRTPVVTRTTHRKIPTRRKSRRKKNLKEEIKKKKKDNKKNKNKMQRKEMNRGKKEEEKEKKQNKEVEEKKKREGEKEEEEEKATMTKKSSTTIKVTCSAVIVMSVTHNGFKRCLGHAPNGRTVRVVGERQCVEWQVTAPVY